MTAKELGQDALRYAGEAWDEWTESLKDSPPAHVYTAVIVLIVFHALKWWLK